MANVTVKNPIVIDTIPSAGTEVFLPNVRTIKKIYWTGTTTDPLANGDDLTIRHYKADADITGDLVFQKRATGVADGCDVTFPNDGYVANGGIVIEVMAGGKLFIYS